MSDKYDNDLVYYSHEAEVRHLISVYWQKMMLEAKTVNERTGYNWLAMETQRLSYEYHKKAMQLRLDAIKGLIHVSIWEMI